MITIPKPCHESWSDMTPKEKGRLCDKCCKVVVDFTSKTTSQIVDFFQASAGQKVCGRFRAEQVAVPASRPLLITRPSRRRIFMAALYLVFGSLLFTSCHKRHEEVMGKMEVRPSHFTAPNGDTAVKKKNPREGQQAKKECKPVITPEIPEPLMGDVMYIPDTVNNKPLNPQQ